MNVTASRHAVAGVEIRAVTERDLRMRTDSADEVDVGALRTARAVFAHRMGAYLYERAREGKLIAHTNRVRVNVAKRSSPEVRLTRCRSAFLLSVVAPLPFCRLSS